MKLHFNSDINSLIENIISTIIELKTLTVIVSLFQMLVGKNL